MQPAALLRIFKLRPSFLPLLLFGFLAGNIAKDAEALEELAGTYVARAFFSKNWQLRDAAVQWLTKEAADGQLADKPNALRTLRNAVVRGLKDKVANVFLSSLALFSSSVDAFGHSAGAREVEQSAEAVLPLLIEKLGDNNARLRDASRESIMFLAGLKEAGLGRNTGLFLKPVKAQTAWRPVLGILQLLVVRRGPCLYVVL